MNSTKMMIEPESIVNFMIIYMILKSQQLYNFVKKIIIYVLQKQWGSSVNDQNYHAQLQKVIITVPTS